MQQAGTMKRKKIDLDAPEPSKVMRCQLALSGALADRIKALMAKYGMEQAAVCRMLMVDGLEARDGRRVA
jgi:hypothetical protein